MKKIVGLLFFFMMPVLVLAKAAPRIEKFPSHQQMLEKIQSLSNSQPAKDYAVGGLFLENENEQLIEAYRRLVSYKDFFHRPVMDIDFWLIFKNSQCHKVLCGAQTIFGAERGTLFLYMMIEYGVNLSHLGYDKLKPPSPRYEQEFKAWYSFRPWQMEELKPYLRAFANLPKKLSPFLNVRMTHSGIVNPLNKNILSNGLIAIYSPLDSKSDFEKETTMYHEIGHNISNLIKYDESDEWLKASGWRVVNGRFVNTDVESFVTEYAKKDFYEDFAESFMYYRYFPETLRAKSPARYQYMRDLIYGRVEYGSAVN